MSIFRLQSSRVTALDTNSKGNVILNTFNGQLSQIWARRFPDKPGSMLQGPPADTKKPAIDLPVSVDQLPSTNEFRGCNYPPVNRS